MSLVTWCEPDCVHVHDMFRSGCKCGGRTTSFSTARAASQAVWLRATWRRTVVAVSGSHSLGATLIGFVWSVTRPQRLRALGRGIRRWLRAVRMIMRDCWRWQQARASSYRPLGRFRCAVRRSLALAPPRPPTMSTSMVRPHGSVASSIASTAWQPKTAHASFPTAGTRCPLTSPRTTLRSSSPSAMASPRAAYARLCSSTAG